MRKTISKSLSIVMSLAMVFSVTMSFPGLAAAQVSPEPNPTLGDACNGLDIALVIDRSGSIGATNMAIVATSTKDFVNAFLANTPSKIGVVSFASTATKDIGLTDDVAALEADIDALVSSGTTNLAEGLQFGRELLETPPANPDEEDRDDATNPDLIVVFTDGQPNAGGGQAGAVIQADLAKTSTSTQPIRIVAVGVGGASQTNLVEITGPNVATDPNDITLATDVIMTDFDNLGTTLANLATTLCDEPPCDCGGPVVIKNSNEAIIGNHVSSRADTGDNYAGGSEGGNGGDAGDIENDGGVGVISGATTGNGGRGGDGGMGGTVLSGNATAGAEAVNVVNTNLTRVGRDDDEEATCCGGSVLSRNRNRAIVFNGVEAKADTGDNAAKGSEGGNGGDSGDIENEDGPSGTITDATTGNGGQGGTGDAGGYVETGTAVSGARSLNIINTNLLRVR